MTHPAEEIRQRGFAVIPNVFDAGEVALLRHRLEELIDEDLLHPDPRRRVDDWMVFNPVVRDPVFLEAVCAPAVLEVVEDLLGPTCILYSCVSSSMPAHGTNYSVRVHVDCQRVIPGYPTNVGVMTVLDDFTDDNGATRFLAGSFERLDPPSDEEFMRDSDVVYPVAGDVVVFNARTWHSGAPNRTDRARHALTANYCRSYMRQHFDFPRMLTSDQAAELGEVSRRILGFNVRVPASLDEYYVDREEDRLYRAGQG